MEEEQKKEERADPCAQCGEYLAGWKRALADYDNLKKDLARERGDMRRDATVASAESFLAVADHFDQALRFQPEVDEKAKAWLSGILHIRTVLDESLRLLGFEPVGKAGEAFDPILHEAAGKRREEGTPPDAILEVMSRGWKTGDRVIRPARVIVNEAN